ncbi:riboflavin synthase [Streptomyces hainanensis]|uniref:Riboflavin synthase n=1 Tax=Streptomyces hainanensis TaxID=402648 RepID=A0A4R4SRI2_9ACTN|nr:riboflavin synthase [Streptomyces hainanensis]TDC66587.1 riboflavin synthase [Streptomyces hainanensis]
MFTGIVEEQGEVIALDRAGDSARLRLSCSVVTEGTGHGGSIAVNGVCLTVIELGEGEFTADVMAETLARSTIGGLVPGDRVNLERPMALGDRLGGHLVQGHVDGTATLLDRAPGDHWDLVTFTLPAELARYVVDKGSITVDGVSLTVVEAGDDRFSIGLIPTTLDLTTLGAKRPGDQVNLEVDVVGKYVERLLGHREVNLR